MMFGGKTRLPETGVSSENGGRSRKKAAHTLTLGQDYLYCAVPTGALFNMHFISTFPQKSLP